MSTGSEWLDFQVFFPNKGLFSVKIFPFDCFSSGNGTLLMCLNECNEVRAATSQDVSLYTASKLNESEFRSDLLRYSHGVHLLLRQYIRLK